MRYPNYTMTGKEKVLNVMLGIFIINCRTMLLSPWLSKRLFLGFFFSFFSRFFFKSVSTSSYIFKERLFVGYC